MARRVQAQDAWSNDPSSVPGTHVKSLVRRCRAVTPELLWKWEVETEECSKSFQTNCSGESNAVVHITDKWDPIASTRWEERTSSQKLLAASTCSATPTKQVNGVWLKKNFFINPKSETLCQQQQVDDHHALISIRCPIAPLHGFLTHHSALPRFQETEGAATKKKKR